MLPEFLTEDSKFTDNIAAATPMATKVRVSLKEGLADRKEWAFTSYFLIGRSRRADVCITNPHVSSLHTYVYFKDGKWWLQDLKYSKGTIVDGEKILKNGSHSMGSLTRLRLSEGGPLLHLNIEKVHPRDLLAEQHGSKSLLSSGGKTIPKEREALDAASSKKKKIRRYCFVAAPVILIGLLLALVGSLQQGSQPASTIKTIQAGQSSSKKGEGIESRTKPDAQTTSTGAKMDDDKGNKESVAIGPDKEAKHDAVQKQAAELYFNAAGKLADNRHWQTALEYYHTVADINPGYPELDVQMARMKSETENGKKYIAAQGFMDKAQYAESAATLASIDRNSVYYTEARQMISEAETKHEQRRAWEAQTAQNNKANKVIRSAMRFYKEGVIGTALEMMDSVLKPSSLAALRIKERATDLKKKMQNAQSLYSRGNKEYENGQLDTASKTLTELLRVDGELLGDHRGLFVNGLCRKIADDYGGMAMKAYTESDYRNAFKYSQLAIKFDKGHGKALNVEKMLLEKSKRLYQDGYILEEYNPEKAWEKWKDVLEICSPDTAYYQKALLKIGKK